MNKFIVQKSETDQKKLSQITESEVNTHINLDQIEDHELITIISKRSQKSLAGLLGVASATLQPLTRDSNLFIRTCIFVLPAEDLSPTTIGEGLYDQLTDYRALQITSKEDKPALPADSKEESETDSTKTKSTLSSDSKQIEGVTENLTPQVQPRSITSLEKSQVSTRATNSAQTSQPEKENKLIPTQGGNKSKVKTKKMADFSGFRADFAKAWMPLVSKYCGKN